MSSGNWQMRKARRALQSSERSEEHTSELQSQSNLVCRLLLEKKKHILMPVPPRCNTKPNVPTAILPPAVRAAHANGRIILSEPCHDSTAMTSRHVLQPCHELA